MIILRTNPLMSSIAVVVGVLLAVHVEPGLAMPVSTHLATKSSSDVGGMILVRWRGRTRGLFEEALIARAIANGVMADPGPIYGRYLGYHGYPGHYPCCYEPQVLERIYNPYYYLSRAGSAHPTWWDYPVHWEGW